MPVSRLFDREIPAEIDEATAQVLDRMRDRLKIYWAENAPKYFSKTKNYRVTFNAKDEVVIRPVRAQANAHLLAHSLKVMRVKYGLWFIREEMLNAGVDYGELLEHGTPDSPGRYILALNMRGKTGVRKGTTNDEWRKWMRDFSREVDKEIVKVKEELGDVVWNQAFKPSSSTSKFTGGIFKRPSFDTGDEF